jgi:hypothetical protein
MSCPWHCIAFGAGLALLVVFWLQLMRWQAHRVSAFFAPDGPHLGPRPSAYALLGGCLSGLFWFAVIFVGGGWVIYQVVMQLF